jgi:hypothetical protein
MSLHSSEQSKHEYDSVSFDDPLSRTEVAAICGVIVLLAAIFLFAVVAFISWIV